MALTYPLVSISSRLQVQKNDASKDAYKVLPAASD
jgi:adenine nucleotide transporter 17